MAYTAAMSQVRRWAALIAGGSLCLTGLALLPLPGPGIPLLLAGLAILAPQSPRARRALEFCRNFLRRHFKREKSSPR